MPLSNGQNNKKVFNLPPWKEIYQTDTERKQDFAEAVKTFEVSKLDYKLIEVPKLIVEARAEFIIEEISK